MRKVGAREAVSIHHLIAGSWRRACLTMAFPDVFHEHSDYEETVVDRPIETPPSSE